MAELYPVSRPECNNKTDFYRYGNIPQAIVSLKYIYEKIKL